MRWDRCEMGYVWNGAGMAGNGQVLSRIFDQEEGN